MKCSRDIGNDDNSRCICPQLMEHFTHLMLMMNGVFLVRMGGTVVYAYGSAEMTALSPGESTSALISRMTMSEISNAEYAAIEDINVTITGYAIGTEGIDGNPSEAWNQCKLIGNIQ